MSSPLQPEVEALSERTLELCGIKSPIGSERDICDHVERWASRHFEPSQRVRVSNSLVLGTFGDPRPTVALVGHLDTVPAHTTDKPPRREGDRLFALGSSDMKGGIAVMMALVERLDRKALPFNVVLVLYEREEGPYLENGLGPVLERVPELSRIKLGIAMEPTDNAVQVGCVGTLHAMLTFKGRSAHSARPWQGENAIHKAGPLLAELLGRPRREVEFAGLSFFEVMSITKANGGRARNVVPDDFQLNLNYRFAPGKSIEQAQEELRQFVNGRAEIEFTDLSPSGHVPKNNALYEQLLKTVGGVPEAKQAWTDVGRLSVHGIDAVNFGPGETAQAHQANESCSVAALGHAYEKLARFLTGQR
ncbi:MAG: succinyl-diaminopimelate desuccinylase [Myxococcaceae bacterium]